MTRTDRATTPDFAGATHAVAALVCAVTDEDLGRPTPCPGTDVAALLDHLAGLTLAFTAAARHEAAPGADGPPDVDGARLDPEFRTSIPAALAELAEAWRDPDAWTGTTRAGGVDLPGEVAGLVALDEVVVHGWDLAVATGQRYEAPAPAVDAALGFVAPTAAEAPQGTPGLFGPVVAVPEDAPVLDRLLGLTGRDPGWRPDGDR
jgi:uncharacterized protein (TIGR03086 family)